MSDRAGYTLALFAIDVSPSMAEYKADPTGTGKVSKLSLVREYVAQMCEPKIMSKRKTEHIGVVSFGGQTNNYTNNGFIEDEERKMTPYDHVSCDVAIQTAKPKIVEVVMNLEVGQHEGNPVSALMVGLDMIQTHKHSKAWYIELTVITDGESSFSQDEYEEAIERLAQLSVKLIVIGINFNPLSEPVDKSKSRNKRLSEKFWRVFTSTFSETLVSTDIPCPFPTLQTFDEMLMDARRPHSDAVNGTVSGIDLLIGNNDVNSDEAIIIPIKYSKATMKARHPTLSKVWKLAMDLQTPLRGQDETTESNSLITNLMSQSQSHRFTNAESLVSADVKHHHTYVLKQIQSLTNTSEPIAIQAEYENGGEEEEFVDPDDLVRAWRFASSWIPVQEDTFDPLDSHKGVEVLGFFPIANIKRYHLMGEVRYVWPDLTSPKAQIEFSALVEAMEDRQMCAVVRWVLRDQAEPVLGACVPVIQKTGDEVLDYMYWVKLPFAEDEHIFLFPSLTTYKTKNGDILKDYPLLPDEEQCELMDQLVLGMDLDEYAKEHHQREEETAQARDEERQMEDSKGKLTTPWFSVTESFNPVTHRIREAIFHAALTVDLDQDPLGPPHPELIKFFRTPATIVNKTQKVTEKLQKALDIKKASPKKVRKRIEKDELGENEGFIDIDELFAEPREDKTKLGILIKDKPEPGRIISNEFSLDDFRNIIK
nr:hypothetical protein L203_05775 [Cryptococcus depauperatus CBS 7841]